LSVLGFSGVFAAEEMKRAAAGRGRILQSFLDAKRKKERKKDHHHHALLLLNRSLMIIICCCYCTS
jgi:hypothetical protein